MHQQAVSLDCLNHVLTSIFLSCEFQAHDFFFLVKDAISFDGIENYRKAGRTKSTNCNDMYAREIYRGAAELAIVWFQEAQ